jgi:hypothetical protein
LDSIRFTRVLAFVAIAAAAIPLASSRAVAADGGEVRIKRASIDITHGGGAEPNDQADISVIFKDVQNPDTCKLSSDDVVSRGVRAALHQGTCQSAPDATASIPSFRPISGSNDALFAGDTAEGETADAIVRRLPTPAGSCGKWKLKLDASNMDLSGITSGPAALEVELHDGSLGCVEVNNTVVDR